MTLFMIISYFRIKARVSLLYLRIKASVSVLYGDLMHAGILKNTREVPEARRVAEFIR